MPGCDRIGAERKELDPEPGIRVGTEGVGETRAGVPGRPGLVLRPGMTWTGAIGRDVDRVGAVTLGRGVVCTGVRGATTGPDG